MATQASDAKGLNAVLLEGTETAVQPTFSIRELPVYGPLVLAPMSGYNDQPFRRLCREFGAALVYTGLLSAKATFYGSRHNDALLRFHPDAKPLVAQIFGNDAHILVIAAQRIEAAGADVLDLNLGCPERKIVSGGSGAALLKDPAKIAQLIRQLVAAVSIPVTAKIRLGWDVDTRNYREVVRALEQSGVSLIAVHGRTAMQAYHGVADWDAIAEIKQGVQVPVLASGDVRCAADIDRVLQHTGCDGVMIGRACIGNPWIFQRRDRDSVPLSERVAVMMRHLHMMVDAHGRYHGVLRFRKHIQKYLSTTDIPRYKRQTLMSYDDPEALVTALETLCALCSNDKALP